VTWESYNFYNCITEVLPNEAQVAALHQWVSLSTSSNT